MKAIELVYQDVLFQGMEQKRFASSQASIAKTLGLSLSTVHRAIHNLSRLGAVEVRRRSFQIRDVQKILYYWASIHNLQKNIIYQTRVELPVRTIEKMMPEGSIFTAYTAYKLRFHEVPADYSEVYVYGGESIMEERFPKMQGVPNLFVLKKDRHIERYGKIVTLATLFVDLWNLQAWYAKAFLKALEEQLHGILE